MSRIYFKKGKNYHIKNDDEVKVIEYENEGKIKIKNCSNNKNYLKDFKKINGKEYVNMITGEILQYNKNSRRNKNSLSKSLKKLKELSLNNFNGGKNEGFATLTYDKRETNFDNAVKDFGDFWKLLKKEFPDLEYIAVIENQRIRTSWHFHMLIKDTKHNSLYIPEEELKRLWNKGNVKISRITNKEINQILSGSDIEDDEEDEKDLKNDNNAIMKVINYMCKTKSKEDIPIGKKIYHHSRGIKFPNVQKMTYKEAQALIENYYLISESTLLVTSCNTDKILKKIKEENYKKDE